MAKTHRPGYPQPFHHPPGRDPRHRPGVAGQRRVTPVGIQFQHGAQRFGPPGVIAERQMVQRQLRNQPPGQIVQRTFPARRHFRQRRHQRGAGSAKGTQQFHPSHRVAAFQCQLRAVIQDRQIAVGTQGADIQPLDRLGHRDPLRPRHRQEQIVPDIAGAGLAAADLILAGAAWAAFGAVDQAGAAISAGGMDRHQCRVGAVAVGIFDMQQLVNLEITRPGAVGMHDMGGGPAIHLDDIALFFEQIDQRRRKQPEIARRYIGQFRAGAVEQQHQFQHLGAALPHHRVQPLEPGIMEPVRHQEIFADQPVALERRAQARQQTFAVTDSDHQRPIGGAKGTCLVGPRHQACAMAKQRVKDQTAPGATGKVEVQPVQRQFRQRPCAFAGQNQPQSGLGRPPLCKPGGIQRAPVLQIFHRLQPHRPQHHILCRGIGGAGRQTVAIGGDQFGAACHQMTLQHGLHLGSGMQHRR